MQEERKLVTILFADVTGSTALGETLDPEDVRGLMARYYEHAREIIPAFGGTLEKFIGDAVMAVFGIPRAHGDDAERAVGAALALRDAVATDEILGAVFRLRIGVNVGEVVAASGAASDQFIASGDAMNTAARLQTAAQPGEILAGERAMYATEDMFSFGKDRLVALKGKSEPCRVFPLAGQRERRRIERPPMAGREAELQQLALVASRVVEDEAPALVSVIGAGGIGKTRLLEEFVARPDLCSGFQATWISFSPYGQAAACEPLRQLLAGLIGDGATASDITKVLAGGDHGAAHHPGIAETILASAGISSAGADDRSSVLAAWRLLTEQVASETPTLIVFDSLQWYGDELVDLVERLAAPRSRVPLLIAVLARPELLDRRPTWGGARQNSTTLILRALGRKNLNALIAHYLPQLSPDERRPMAERAGGNPFFALELIRAARDRPADSRQLPATVHAAILARLDLLSDLNRAVVRTASAAGPTLPTSAFGCLVDAEEADLETAIEELLTSDLLEQAGTGLDFRHALIRDVAYNSLSRTERIRIHAATAEHLGDLGGEELAQVIAHHYRTAISLSRQSAIGLKLPFAVDRAIEALKRASRLSAHTGSFLEAQIMLECAIHISPAEERAQLEELLGDSVGWSAAAVDAYRSALDRLAQAGQDDGAAGVRLRRKLLILLTRGALADRMDVEPAVLRDYYLKARQLALSAASDYERWRLRVVDMFFRPEGQYLDEVGGQLVAADPAGRLVTAERAAEYFASVQDWAAYSEALDGAHSVAAAMGQPRQALEFCLRRLAIGDLAAAEFGDALSMLSAAYWNTGDPAKSIEIVQSALRDVQPGQPIVHLSHAIAQAVSVSFHAGQWDIVESLRQYLEEAYEQSLSSPQDTAFCVDGFFCLFWVAAARLDRADANRFASLISHSYSTMPHLLPIVSALLDMEASDDPGRCLLTPEQLGTHALSVLVFRNERGLASEPGLVAEAARNPAAASSLTLEIATALATESAGDLARLISELEARRRLVSAARLRITLGRLSRDATELERAIALLEQIGDLRFLERAGQAEAAVTGQPQRRAD